ncbi:hypothetical protein [Mariprofundus sp. EBB-1]|uniref:hypothetical protein n=1 Tax=Mariprofundus sp. EBB-1 TaxID=2650971 RepID=UPI0011C46B99|nr:hypothetical protein [Mariprofundus sp. EBB-1]
MIMASPAYAIECTDAVKAWSSLQGKYSFKALQDAKAGLRPGVPHFEMKNYSLCVEEERWLLETGLSGFGILFKRRSFRVLFTDSQL